MQLSFSSPKLTTKTWVSLAMFMAMDLVLRRFSFGTSFVKLGPAFIATILMAYYLGPWIAAIGAALCDQINVLIFSPGVNFLGFTLTAIVAAIIYGLFFSQKPVRLWRVAVAVLAVTLLCNVLMNTLWLQMMGTPWQGIIGVRLIKDAIVYPIQVAVSYAVLKGVARVKPTL